MTDLYPHLHRVIKAANEVRTERDVANGNLDTFITDIAHVMVAGVVYGGEGVSHDALLDWHAGITADRVALICSAYALPESNTETREDEIMDKFLTAWNEEVNAHISRRAV